MRISDWSSDVCSSDLQGHRPKFLPHHQHPTDIVLPQRAAAEEDQRHLRNRTEDMPPRASSFGIAAPVLSRSEEHTSELQSLMRISYAVFCLKKKTITTHNNNKKQLHAFTQQQHKKK